MEIQTKERLTGAIILVVLIVTLVPELLSGPKHKVNAEASPALEGPPQHSYTIDLSDAPARPAGAAAPPADAAHGAAAPAGFRPR